MISPRLEAHLDHHGHHGVLEVHGVARVHELAQLGHPLPRRDRGVTRALLEHHLPARGGAARLHADADADADAAAAAAAAAATT
jgi:hypothetical protein